VDHALALWTDLQHIQLQSGAQICLAVDGVVLSGDSDPGAIHVCGNADVAVLASVESAFLFNRDNAAAVRHVAGHVCVGHELGSCRSDAVRRVIGTYGIVPTSHPYAGNLSPYPPPE